MKIEIVIMFTRDRYENHKFFNLFPLPCRQFYFLDVFKFAKHVLFQMNVKVTAETGLKCICVYIHPTIPVWIHAGLKSISRFGSAGGMTCIRQVWLIFVPVTCININIIINKTIWPSLTPFRSHINGTYNSRFMVESRDVVAKTLSMGGGGGGGGGKIFFFF